MPKTLKEVFPHKFSVGDTVKVIARGESEWCRVGDTHKVRVCRHDYEDGAVYVVDEDDESSYIRECNLELLDFTPLTDDSVTFGAQWDQIDGPIKWRDTIIHCQAIIEDCEREIERNTQQLADEGFLLIAPIADVRAVDMNDWRNWKDGDKIRMTADDWCDLSKGEIYEIIDKGRDYITILDDVDYRRKLDIDGETMFEDGRLIDFEFVSSQ